MSDVVNLLIISSLLTSAAIPLIMVVQSRSAARRFFRWAMLALLPTNTVTCGVWVSQGERGFLSIWQWLSMATLLLILSVLSGSGLSRLKDVILTRRSRKKLKRPEPEV